MYAYLPFLLLLGSTLAQEATVEPVTGAVTQESTNVKNTSCVTEDNQVGQCVHYYLCNDTIEPSGEGIIDLHVSFESPCEDYMDICCKEPVLAEKLPQPAKGCGWRNPNGVGHQLKGSDAGKYAEFAEFPWVVAILKTDDDPNGQYIGSGSLIDRRVVLTTAHHVVKAKKLRVRAGEWDAQTDKELYPHQERDVESTVVHKDFNKALFYDIALLFLAKPFDAAANIGIACLPQPKLKAEADTKCFTTGWGKDRFGHKNYQTILRKAEFTVMPHKDCRDRLRQTRLGSQFELHHTFMCAFDKEGRCEGDGGSPLVCPMELQKDRYVQNGMMAWGIGCGQDDNPSVFVDVSVLRNWIDNEVLGKGIEILEYEKY